MTGAPAMSGPEALVALDDAALVRRCRGGDEAAWGVLVERFSRYVFAISTQAYRLGHADAEDVFQEVFARTFQQLERLRDDAAIRPWIGQLTRRLCVDRLRATRRESPDAEVEERGEEDAVLARLEEAITVRAAMAQLSETCREVLDRFFARDESYVAISAALDVPQGTIASRISRCLARLRGRLEGRSDASGPSGVVT